MNQLSKEQVRFQQIKREEAILVSNEVRKESARVAFATQLTQLFRDKIDVLRANPRYMLDVLHARGVYCRILSEVVDGLVVASREVRPPETSDDVMRRIFLSRINK